MIEFVWKIYECFVFIYVCVIWFVDSLEGMVKNLIIVKLLINVIIEYVLVIFYGGRIRISVFVLVSECLVRFCLIFFDYVCYFIYGFKDFFFCCCVCSLDELFLWCKFM